MAVSVTDKELLKYFTQLNEPQKRSLLQMMKAFLNSEKAVSEQNISLLKYNKELDEAMERIDKNIYTTLEELEKEMDVW